MLGPESVSGRRGKKTPSPLRNMKGKSNSKKSKFLLYDRAKRDSSEQVSKDR